MEFISQGCSLRFISWWQYYFKATPSVPPFSLSCTRMAVCETTWLLMIMGQVDLWLDGLCVLLRSLTGGYYGLSVTQNLQTHKSPAPALNDLDSLALPAVLLSILQQLVWVIWRNSVELLWSPSSHRLDISHPIHSAVWFHVCNTRDVGPYDSLHVLLCYLFLKLAAFWQLCHRGS